MPSQRDKIAALIDKNIATPEQLSTKELFETLFYEADLRLTALESLGVDWNQAKQDLLTQGLLNLSQTLGPIYASLVDDIGAAEARLATLLTGAVPNADLTGAPTADAPVDPSDSSRRIVNTAYLRAALTALQTAIVGAAPGSLDTLVEIATQLGADEASSAAFVSTMTAALAGKQPLDSDLTAIAGLTPADDDILQRKAGAWINRTPAQIKSDLAIAAGDVSGLGSLATASSVTASQISDATANGRSLITAANYAAMKTLLALNNVDNTSDATKNAASAALTSKTINAALNTLSNLDMSMFAANVVDTDGTLAANSDSRVATQKAVKTLVNALLGANDAEVYKGVIDCSANPNYPAADAGHVYRVSVAGKIGGAAGVNVEVGDRLQCIVDGTASGTQAGVGANWWITQANIDGAVIGPASVTDGNPAVFDGATGKLLKQVTFSAFKTSLAIAAADITDSDATGRALLQAATVDAALSTLAAGQRHARGDATYTILTTDRVIAITTAFTQARTWTIPLANSVAAGDRKTIIDEAGGSTSFANPLTLACSGSDTINGAASVLIGFRFREIVLESDGTSKWTVVPQAHVESGAWTPVLTCATLGNLNVVYSKQVGRWMRSGPLLTARFRIETSTFTWTTASGLVSITGLPSASANITDSLHHGSLSFSGITKASYTQFGAQLAENSSSLIISANGQGQTSASLQIADLPSGGSVVLRGQIAYEIG